MLVQMLITFALPGLLVRAVVDREVEKTWLKVRGREAWLFRRGADHRFVLEDVVAMRPSRRHLTLELRDGRSFSLRAADPEALRDAFEAVGAGVSDGEPVEEPVQLQDLRRRVGSAV